jgi:hypothetical protein
LRILFVVYIYRFIAISESGQPFRLELRNGGSEARSQPAFEQILKEQRQRMKLAIILEKSNVLLILNQSDLLFEFFPKQKTDHFQFVEIQPSAIAHVNDEKTKKRMKESTSEPEMFPEKCRFSFLVVQQLHWERRSSPSL